MEAKLKEIESVMTDHPDFPKPGILFKNIMPIFSDPKQLANLADILEDTIRKNFPGCTKLVGLESRGFLMGKCQWVFLLNWVWKNPKPTQKDLKICV